MKTSLVAFIFGVILIAVAILGGGFELKELKVPKVSWLPRFVSGLVGAVFVVVGMALDIPDNPGTSVSGLDSPEPTSAINFTINDNLGTEIGQESEQVGISINGRLVGTLTVNQNYPSATLTVTVPKPGQYTYTANANAVFNDGQERTCAGQGNIDVIDGKSFNLSANIGGNTCSINLQEE
jgi:hypothetical protein